MNISNNEDNNTAKDDNDNITILVNKPKQLFELRLSNLEGIKANFHVGGKSVEIKTNREYDKEYAKIMKRDGEENDTEEFFSKLIYLGIHKVMIGSSHVHI